MASAFHDRDDVTDSTMRSLAEVMNHTPEVQRSHYIFQERKKSVRKLQDMMMKGVRGGASGSGKIEVGRWTAPLWLGPVVVDDHQLPIFLTIQPLSAWDERNVRQLTKTAVSTATRVGALTSIVSPGSHWSAAFHQQHRRCPALLPIVRPVNHGGRGIPQLKSYPTTCSIPVP
jgi:hypothetical protein